MNTKTTVHRAWCSFCPLRNSIQGERYVCQTCPDVDLCSQCMKKYNTTRSDKWCWKHQFLQVLGSSSDNDQVIKIKLLGENRSQWLKGLAERYNQASPSQTASAEWSSHLQTKLFGMVKKAGVVRSTASGKRKASFGEPDVVNKKTNLGDGVGLGKSK
jgi:hypothetical protein